jgi:hypothetical protein
MRLPSARRRSMATRMSGSVIGAVTSCPSLWRPARAARGGWPRPTRRLEQQRAQEARPIPASRPARLREAKRRLEEDFATEVRRTAAAYRANGRMRNGRRLGAHSPPKPYSPPETPQGKINVTDPDSRNVNGVPPSSSAPV